ncbi:MAG: EF-hand domain-containing protein [Vicinamibacterales bacterium]
MLTPLQTRKLTRLFVVLDADRDNALERSDYDEIVANLAKIRGWSRGSAEYAVLEALYIRIWEELKRLADTSGDGRVGLREFLDFHDLMLGTSALHEQITLATVDLLFQAFDRDQDGYVSLDDFRMFFAAYRIRDRAVADEAFRKLDVERRGRISRTDATDRVQEFYFSDSFDAPGNWLFGPFD